MKIGVDLLGCNASYSGGVATFSIGIARGLARTVRAPDSVVVFVSDDNEEFIHNALQGIPVAFEKLSRNPLRKYIFGPLKYLAWTVRYFKLLFWFEKMFRPRMASQIESAVDVLVVPTTTLSLFALRIPTILCMHDIQQEYFPEFFSFRERASRWVTYRLSAWSASSIQVSSDFVKNCLIEKFKFVKEEKIFIAYEGVDFSKFNDGSTATFPVALNRLRGGQFVFYPAQLWPHKNHLLLLEALVEFRDAHGYEMPCVLTGQDCGYWSEISNAISKFGLTEVYYLGRVCFEELIWLYRNCDAVLSLGLHESSSLPVREGAVFGKPLICSDIPPNIETQKYLALNLVRQHETGSLSSMLGLLASGASGIKDEAQNNKVRVKCFDWDLIARKYLAAIEGLSFPRKPSDSSVSSEGGRGN